MESLGSIMEKCITYVYALNFTFDDLMSIILINNGRLY